LSSGPKLVNVIYIRASPRALWKALTEGKYTRKYYAGLELHAELERGGRFEIHKRDGPGVAGHVIDLVPKKKLVHSFEPRFIDDGPSRVSYEIEPMGMVCRLTVTHDDFPPSGPTLGVVREGWPEILSSLKSLLETGRPLVIPRDR
jgi:uncharacterized protein YndB with AHSA1/START domain